MKTLLTFLILGASAIASTQTQVSPFRKEAFPAPENRF